MLKCDGRKEHRGSKGWRWWVVIWQTNTCFRFSENVKKRVSNQHWTQKALLKLFSFVFCQGLHVGYVRGDIAHSIDCFMQEATFTPTRSLAEA